MTRDEVRVLIIDLVQELNRASSWTGETHIQKAAYFLSELFEVNLSMPFVLYKYGPYSFDLKNELLYLEAIGILEKKDTPPYGSQFSLGQHAKSFKTVAGISTEKYQGRLAWITNKVFATNPGVSELEKKATALYALKNFHVGNNDRAEKINQIKPHISKEQALGTIQLITEWQNEIASTSNLK